MFLQSHVIIIAIIITVQIRKITVPTLEILNLDPFHECFQQLLGAKLWYS